MLVLTRRFGAKLQIGDNISITVIEKSDSQIQLGILAPRNIVIQHEEICLAQSPHATQASIQKSGELG